MKPHAKATPFMMAAMPNSRTPYDKWLPRRLRNRDGFWKLVRLALVRSALPPNSSGSCGTSAFWLALRVASGGLLCDVSQNLRQVCCIGVELCAHATLKFSRQSGVMHAVLANSLFHWCCAWVPCDGRPRLRPAFPVGISNGA